METYPCAVVWPIEKTELTAVGKAKRQISFSLEALRSVGRVAPNMNAPEAHIVFPGDMTHFGY